MIKVLELVVWVLAGCLVLVKPSKPSKIEYLLVWVCLLLTLAMRIIKS